MSEKGTLDQYKIIKGKMKMTNLARAIIAKADWPSSLTGWTSTTPSRLSSTSGSPVLRPRLVNNSLTKFHLESRTAVVRTVWLVWSIWNKLMAVDDQMQQESFWLLLHWAVVLVVAQRQSSCLKINWSWAPPKNLLFVHYQVFFPLLLSVHTWLYEWCIINHTILDLNGEPGGDTGTEW